MREVKDILNNLLNIHQKSVTIWIESPHYL